MSIFNNFKNTEVKIEAPKDVIGSGNKFGIVETDVYTAKIKMAYADTSKGGAMSVNFEFETTEGNIINSTQWISSGTAKGCKNFYTDAKGNNQYLPGYSLVDDICQLVEEGELASIETEERPVEMYDFDAKKRLPKLKEVLVDLLGKTVKIAVEKQVVDKNIKDADGKYVPSGQTREVNELVKAFHAENEVTLTEAKAGKSEAGFMTNWIEKNKNVIKDKTKKVKVDKSAPVAKAAPTKSLFS